MKSNSVNHRKWCSYCRKDDHNDNECWCTRAVPHPAKSAMDRALTGPEQVRATSFFTLPEEPPGFSDVDPIFMCKDPEHGFPTHLHVPSGKKYVHYCPSCRFKSVAFGVVVS